MLEEATKTTRGNLDEFRLRDELRALRTQIPDTPALNPIVSVAFDLSRRLESGEISFDELRDLAIRLMDRACVQRGLHLRERVGFVDRATTYEEFANFVEAEAKDADFETFKARWSRPRTGIVLTAHPTFGLSEALSKRIVEIAVSNGVDPNTPIGHPHRPDDNIDLAYEHRRAQKAIKNLRNAYTELLHSFYTAAFARFGDKAYTIRPRLATIASWVGYDLDGRTDISWIASFIIRLHEKRASFVDIHERIQALEEFTQHPGRYAAAGRGRSPASSTSPSPPSTSRSPRCRRWWLASRRWPTPPTSSPAPTATTSPRSSRSSSCCSSCSIRRRMRRSSARSRSSPG